MKIIRKTAFLLSLFFMLIQACEKDTPDLTYQNSKYFQDQLGCMNMPRPADSYNYLIYPTMDKWAEFNTVEEMMQACQIPEKKLNAMSTQALIQALWEYPFFIDIVHRVDHFQMDFINLLGDNNAYKLLEKRIDAPVQLLERYRLMPSICEALLHPKAFEVLLSQPLFISRLSLNEQKEVVRLAFEKDSLRQEYPQHANSATREVTWFLVGRVMRQANYSPFVAEINRNKALKIFLDTSVLDRRYGHYEEETLPMLQNLITHGKAFIN